MRIDLWHRRLSWVLLFVGATVVNTASANLILGGTADGVGGGIGTSNVVLTVGATPDEEGCVGWDGTANVVGATACTGGLSPVIVGGDEKTGSSQTQTRTITETGVSSASDLVVVLSANEGATSFTLTNLSLTVYAPNGAILFNSGNLGGAPINLDTSLAGSLGFAFVFDPTQAALADPFISGAGAASNRIGLAVSLTNVDGGNETFSVADISAVAINVPEPPISLTILTGLGIVVMVRARRRRFSTPIRTAN